jgi:peptidyl-tRNA hydrolase ICT1
MATALRSTGLLRLGFRHVPSLLFRGPLFPAPSLPALSLGLGVDRVGLVRFRCSASEAGDGKGKKVSARLALAQQVMRDAEERAASAGSDPAPKITMGNTLQPPALIAPIWLVL